MDTPDISSTKEGIYFVDFDVSTLLTSAAACFIMFGGILPYIPQYRDIKSSENIEGFSTYVCLTLLIANTLRILFWFGKQFELPLLVQSIVMNLAMLIMIELIVRIRYKNTIIPNKPRYFLDLDLHYFWKWTDFVSYIECMATFTVVMGMLMYLFLDIPVFVETMGFLALITEALLGFPQLLKNFTNKSTTGMSKKMVTMWTLGDLFKTGYFFARKAPIQFWLCGILQVCIDMVILTQVLIYKNAKKLSKDYRS